MRLKERGFTLVELIIVLVIMVILLGLGVVSMGNIQAQARDKERAQAVSIIARGLENRYNIDNPVVINAPGNDTSKGTYPGVNETLHIDGWSRTGWDPEQHDSYRTEAFPGTTDEAFYNPSGNWAWSIVCVWACQPAGTASQVQSAFNMDDGDKYVYEPYDASNNICCCGGCVGYNLYWKSEVDKTPYLGIAGLKVLRSKHR